ncbi:uncharacterized protein BXZ73DRAFT_105105 [Epithele typhae]|nr:uncharacterized protein BXZ73DRAFT_105105 [Epithele typhae]KAH9918707.1 hypothetical protein BXZ73DRAFT_105105 [Epithele typhae]
MERKIVSQNAHMPIFPQSNLHLNILMGRDETLECTGFMTPEEMSQSLGI